MIQTFTENVSSFVILEITNGGGLTQKKTSRTMCWPEWQLRLKSMDLRLTIVKFTRELTPVMAFLILKSVDLDLLLSNLLISQHLRWHCLY